MEFKTEEILIVNKRMETLVVPFGIKKVICVSLGLKVLVLSDACVHVDCSNNNLGFLHIPPNIVYLDCNNNKIRFLNLRDRKHIEYIDCYDNELDDIKVYSDHLEHLCCCTNNIKKITLSYSKVLTVNYDGTTLTTTNTYNDNTLKTKVCSIENPHSEKLSNIFISSKNKTKVILS
ncbi:MAG: hypothetical protein COA94_02925 [Rickettsiales bacterium]|nr:MAG: hypothetical protein COA94_02925 [Rickettsiales bacterium]